MLPRVLLVKLETQLPLRVFVNMEGRVPYSTVISQYIENYPFFRLHWQYLLAVLVLPSLAEVAFTQKILGFSLGLEQGCSITTVDTDCPE